MADTPTLTASTDAVADAIGCPEWIRRNGADRLRKNGCDRKGECFCRTAAVAVIALAAVGNAMEVGQ
jgi:hypothetical protein